MTTAGWLRELLKRDGLIAAPGAYDCITACAVEHAGFPAVYMTGAGTAATLGYPDYDLVTTSEMAENAARLAAAARCRPGDGLSSCYPAGCSVHGRDWHL